MADEPFCFTTSPRSKAGVSIVKISGPLTLKHLFGFQEAFRAMKPPILILDLAECIYMDSAGLGLIMNQFVSCQNGKRRLILTGVNYRVQALLDLTKVSSVLEQFSSTEVAEASLQDLTRAI